jgi:hypothetical protein
MRYMEKIKEDLKRKTWIAASPRTEQLRKPKHEMSTPLGWEKTK